jgi:hypothetical protein
MNSTFPTMDIIDLMLILQMMNCGVENVLELQFMECFTCIALATYVKDL